MYNLCLAQGYSIEMTDKVGLVLSLQEKRGSLETAILRSAICQYIGKQEGFTLHRVDNLFGLLIPFRPPVNIASAQ